MTWIYTMIGGLVVGIGGTVLVIRQTQPEQESGAAQVVEVVETLTAPSVALTETDLLEVPCSSDYIATNGEGLCRELFCRMTTRGIDSKTSGKECEEIGNLLNSLRMLKACQDQDDKQGCYDVFRYRK